MNKKQLIQKAAEKSGFTQKETTELLDTILEIATDELADGGNVLLTGFGCLEAKTRKARKGAHPRTGEPIDIPPVHTVVFRTGSSLQAKLDESKSE